MGQVLELFGLPYLEKRLEDQRGALSLKGNMCSPAQMRRIFRKKTSDPGALPDSPSDRLMLNSPPTHTLMDIAILEHARGTSAAEVRDLFRQAAAGWEPVIAAMDFKPRVWEGIEPNRWDAEAYLASNRGTIKKVKGGYRYNYKAIPEPLWSEVHEALQCAAISGDRDLAQRLARAYQLKPASEIARDELFTFREYILRHLLAGDDDEARKVAKGLKPGYQVDFPQELVEFPLGVVRNDPELLLKGLKTLNTRFKNKWDERHWRKRYEKLKSGEIRARAVPKTWEVMLVDVRDHLYTLHWLMSPIALAFLNIARWRGMESPFDKPKAFSEWIPLSLCSG